MPLKLTNWNRENGVFCPFGATWNAVEKGYNFSIYSKTAWKVSLLFFKEDNPYNPVYQYNFDVFKNKTNAIWHCFIPEADLQSANCYAYQMDGPNTAGNQFNVNKLLLDPWAKAVFFPPDFSREATKGEGSNMGKAALAQLVTINQNEATSKKPVHFHDLIIYELHVKGFTQHASSTIAEARRGTFLGVIDLIPYLKDLGITAVELMPVHQFDIQENNYWGYMTLNFFAPHNKYCVNVLNAVAEFKQMVDALHAAGIEVILDVIYNHSSEGGFSGPFYSYKGIDNSSYYLLSPDLSRYIDDAGTGNVMRTSYKTVRKLILDSLKYWATEMKVDGFRFDLASIFTRNDDGSINLTNPPILEEISMDPVLSNLHLIAEPWDMASYQLGTKFPGSSWKQWNGEFRDDIRKFVKGDNDVVSKLMTRIYGSGDLFPDYLPFSCHPGQSINFITAHDGFTLYDLVSYNQKHNQANGHNNTDGSDGNHSWNCGTEGDDNLSPDILKLRKKQAKNLTCLLMLSNGIPMFRMGDEFLQTQSGNNNSYNQDNETSWLDWTRKEKFSDIFRFFKMIINFRKSHLTICRSEYWREDLSWFGVGKDVDMSFSSHSLAYFLSGKRVGDSDLYVMINAYWQPLNFEIQVGAVNDWKRIIDTSLDSPADIVSDAEAQSITSLSCKVAERSIVVLTRG